LRLSTLALAILVAVPLSSQPPRKKVLAWGDTMTAYQHDSVSHALATIDRLGHAGETWDNPAIRKMYLEAIKWALRLIGEDVKPGK
jgi:hypothetical protein